MAERRDNEKPRRRIYLFLLLVGFSSAILSVFFLYYWIRNPDVYSKNAVGKTETHYCQYDLALDETYISTDKIYSTNGVTWVNGTDYFLDWFAFGFIGYFTVALAAILMAISVRFKLNALTILSGFFMFGVLVPGAFVFVYFGINAPNYYGNAEYECTDWDRIEENNSN